MNEAVVLPAGLTLLGLGTFVAVLSLWESIAQTLRGYWRGYAAWVDENMRALHRQVTPTQFLKQHLLITFSGFVLGLALGSTGKGLFMASLAAGVPVLQLRITRQKRHKALEAQLDAALQTISSNMLATQNIVEGFGAVASHLMPPISQEADLLVKDVKVGARTEEALIGFGERCRSQHVDAVVTALCIGLRTGGDMGATLKKIAHVVRETIRCEQMMSAKTAAGRTSAWIVGAMPLVFGLIMQQMEPDLMRPLWTTTLGTVFLAIATVLDLLGIFLAIKVTKIDP